MENLEIRKFRRNQIDCAVRYNRDNGEEIAEWSEGAFVVDIGTGQLFRNHDAMIVEDGEWVMKYDDNEEENRKVEWWVFTDQTMKQYFTDVTEELQ